MPVGGDILEIKVAHPDLGGKTLYPKSGEAFTFDKGGFVNNDDAASVDGGGRMIVQKTRKLWSAEGPISQDATADELQYMQDVANSNKPATYTISHINGSVYKGVGTPVGELQEDSLASTFNLKLAGGGVLTKIA